MFWLIRTLGPMRALDATMTERDMVAGQRCRLPKDEAVRAVRAGLAVMLSPDGLEAVAKDAPEAHTPAVEAPVPVEPPAAEPSVPVVPRAPVAPRPPVRGPQAR